MQVFIGLDGGGTSCRARAERADGQRSPIREGGPANVASDLDGAVAAITELLAQVHADARALAPGAEAPVVALGLAGLRESGREAALRAALPFPRLILFGDVEASVAGALRKGDGIIMAVGTGSVLAAQASGRIRRLGGYGLHLGDDASGAYIGREALRRALLARDGLGVAGPLTEAIWTRFITLPALTAFAAEARPADYAALAPEVLAHDRALCPVAGAILDQACSYLSYAINVLQQGSAPMPVTALGGLGPYLLDRIIRSGGTRLRVVQPIGTALDGALWLARRSAEQTP